MCWQNDAIHTSLGRRGKFAALDLFIEVSGMGASAPAPRAEVCKNFRRLSLFIIFSKIFPVCLCRSGIQGTVKYHHPVFQGVFLPGFQDPFLVADGTELEKHILFPSIAVGGPHAHGFGMGLVVGVTQEENA